MKAAERSSLLSWCCEALSGRRATVGLPRVYCPAGVLGRLRDRAQLGGVSRRATLVRDSTAADRGRATLLQWLWTLERGDPRQRGAPGAGSADLRGGCRAPRAAPAGRLCAVWAEARAAGVAGALRPGDKPTGGERRTAVQGDVGAARRALLWTGVD